MAPEYCSFLVLLFILINDISMPSFCSPGLPVWRSVFITSLRKRLKTTPV